MANAVDDLLRKLADMRGSLRGLGGDEAASIVGLASEELREQRRMIEYLAQRLADVGWLSSRCPYDDCCQADVSCNVCALYEAPPQVWIDAAARDLPCGYRREGPAIEWRGLKSDDCMDDCHLEQDRCWP